MRSIIFIFSSSETNLRLHPGEEDVRVGRQSVGGRLSNGRRSSAAENILVAWI